jgi:hypothetical protein
LRVVNEPSVYISGEKMGQKVYPPGAGTMHGVPPPVPPMQQPGMPMNFSQQQAMVAQQNSNMEMLERRREQERARNRSGSTSTVSEDVLFWSFCTDTLKAPHTLGG